MRSNDSPFVTVYITNYNYADYLEQSIKSILNQTFQDFELIIIDDGSTDDSREIIRRYESHDKIFTIFQQNRGLNKTSNTALKMARGRYIMRLDADDFMDPHALEIMVQELERHPECAMVFPDYYLVDEEGNIIDQVRRHDFKEEVSILDQPAHGACTIFRRDILLKYGGYDEDFSCQDCYDVWLKFTPKHKVINVNLPLFYYRKHPQSLTKDESRILDARAAIKAKHVEMRGTTPLRVCAVLPIRGKAIDPRSFPLTKLGEKPLIDWTLEAALGSKNVTEVLVSTPDPDVQHYVRAEYSGDVLVVERTREMARINIPLAPTLLEALRYYLKEHDPPDLMAILFIEAPFRSAFYIDKAINTIQLYEVDVVDGIREEDDVFYFHNGDGLQPWNLNSGLRLEREGHYRRAGGLHIIWRDFIEKERNMLSGKIGHIALDQRAAFTIRTEVDWQIAQFLAKQEI